MSMNTNPTIIIDNGSECSKAGFSGYDFPEYMFPSIVGRRHKKAQWDIEELCFGDEIQNYKDIYNIIRPIEYGRITKWEEIEKIWCHIFNKLQAKSGENPILLTEALPNYKSSREITTQIMFENFHIPAMYLAAQPVLSLYVTGRLTGMVFESGDGWTQPISIYEGYGLPKTSMRYFYAGLDLTDYLKKLLGNKGYLSVIKRPKNLKYIKENICFIAENFEEEIKTNFHENIYQLPDGQEVSIGKESFLCGEALLKPTLLGLEVDNVPKTIYNSIMKSDANIQNTLFSNIILGGGNTMFPGIEHRLKKELKSIVSSSTKLNIISHPNRKYSAWIGGSLLTTLSTFKNMCITKSEYDEYGPSIVHRKCF